jgi:Concanavalin A-like lectin/glucanases superfamily
MATNLSTTFRIRPPGAASLTAVLDPGSSTDPAIQTSTGSGISRHGAGVGVSVSGTTRLTTAPGNVSVLANAVVTTDQVTTGAGTRVDGMPRRLPTWQNLGSYTDPPGAKLLLTLSNVSTATNTPDTLFVPVMTANTTSGFTASASSSYNASLFPLYTIFDRNTSTFHAGASVYSYGSYIGSVSTVVAGVTVVGEWVQIQVPVATRLTRYGFVPRSGFTHRVPGQFVVAGSTNGVSWSLIDQRTGARAVPQAQYADNTELSFAVTGSQSYTFFRLIVTTLSATAGNSNTFDLAEWRLYKADPTVPTWGPTAQTVLANRPTYVSRDPTDGEPAIAFDRTVTQSLKYSSAIPFNCLTNGGLTAVVHVKFTGTPASYENVFIGTSAIGDAIFMERNVTNNYFGFYVRNGSTLIAYATVTDISQNTWYILSFRLRQVAGVWTPQAYKNGVLSSSAAVTFGDVTDRILTSFIVSNNGGLNGSIRFVGVWDRPLSDAELARVTEAARIYPDLQGPAPIVRVLQSARDSCLVEPAADMLLPGPGGFAGSGISTVGAVLLQDGRIFCTPYSGTTARLVDPRTNSVTTPAVTFPGGQFFRGGIVLPNGKVFLVPYNSTYALLFDPATETISTSTAGFPGSAAFSGATLLADGTVFLCPYQPTYALLYDYRTDSVSTPPVTFPGGGAFGGCVLTPDGKVLCIPYTGSTARLFDPVAQTLSTPSGTFAGNFNSGVMLPSGKIFCCPSTGATTARVFDWQTNSLSTPNGTYASGGWRGGVRMACGRVALIPYNNANCVIYDEATDSLSTAQGAIASPSNSYWGGTLLPDGRIFMAPLAKTSAVYLHSGGPGLAPIPMSVLLSPYCNNNVY